MRTGSMSRLGSVRRVALVSLLMVAGIVATCASCAPALLPPRPVGYLDVDPALLEYFNAWHGTLEVEHAVVLYGRVDGLVVRVEGFDATDPIYADSISVQFRLHDPRATRIIGTLHTHPYRPGLRCRPSETDLRTLYHRPRYMVALVACGGGKFGYALKGDPRYYEIRRRQ